MQSFYKHLAAVALGVAAAAATTGSFAQTGPDTMNSARERAVHSCSSDSIKKMPESTWGVQQLDMYRACMAQHGMQRE